MYALYFHKRDGTLSKMKCFIQSMNFEMDSLQEEDANEWSVLNGVHQWQRTTVAI
jgi:hypothetical protein